MNFIKKNTKELLKEFSSKEYQLSEWSKKQTWFFPSEFVCQWFDDTVSEPKRLIKDNELTEDEWEIIKPFHKLFDKHANEITQEKFDENPILLLDYKPWQEIQKKAKETLKKLKEIGW